MEDKSKHTDELIKDLLQEQDLEMPAVDFTSNIMERLALESVVRSTKPIISPFAWYIVMAFVAIVVCVSFGEINPQQSEFMNYFQWKMEMPDIAMSGSIFTPILFVLSTLLWLFFVVDKFLSSKLKIR